MQQKKDILAMKKNVIETSTGHNRDKKFQSWLMVAICIVSLTIYFSFFSEGTYLENMNLLTFIGILILLSIFFFWFITFIYNPIEFLKEKVKLKRSIFNQAGEEIELTIDSHGIVEENIGKSVKIINRISWDGVKRVSHDKHRYFVYYEDRAALLLPKEISRAGEEQKEDYQALIHKYILPRTNHQLKKVK
ncbi:YcxB family protein [Paraliobacillus zengyii]|uniref:YcxB family protein n=1 Tax=Paraliobacillus zengyii TaxID=2213194 RepID=UPI0013A6C1EA|nr:YcxB family protein [Paraliobacillus zengyii]